MQLIVIDFKYLSNVKQELHQ